MEIKKYVTLSKLQVFLDNLSNKFAKLVHKHSIYDITDYTVDSALSPTSTNPIQNNVVDAEFEAIAEAMNALETVVDEKIATFEEAINTNVNAVRYDTVQELEYPQHQRALFNIEAPTIDDIYDGQYTTIDYSWDGDINNRDSFNTKHHIYYKVSDNIPSDDVIINCIGVLEEYSDGSSGYFQQTNRNIYKGEKFWSIGGDTNDAEGSIIFVKEAGIHAYGDNGELTFTAPSAGVYSITWDEVEYMPHCTLRFLDRDGLHLHSHVNRENRFIVRVDDNGAIKTVDSNGNVVWDGSDIAGTITTDTTLSKSGVPADAKAVGDALQVDTFTVALGENGTLGGYKTGDVIKEDTDIKTILNKLLRKAIPATYDKPTVSLDNNKGTAKGNIEAGSTITPKLKASFVKNDSGGLTGIKIMQGGTIVANDAAPTGTTLEYNGESFVIEDETITFTASADYSAAPPKNNNLGEQCTENQFGSGTVTASYSIAGKRKLFYGTGEGALPTITSDVVRGLSNKKLAPANGESFTFNVDIGQQHIIIAYPNSLKDIDNITYVTANDPDFIGKFTKAEEDVDVADARGGENGLAKYKVYTYAMDVPAKVSMSFKFTIKK